MEVVGMQLLASCSLDEACSFNGKLVIPCEGGEKVDKVLLNVCVKDEDHTEVFERVNKSFVKCITFSSENPVRSVPSEYKGMVFNECSFGELLDGTVSVGVEGAVTLVRLPSEFPSGELNMRSVYEASVKYPDVRFIGGKLLALEGVSIGRYDNGKSSSCVYDGVYDSFIEANLHDLDNITELVRKSKKVSDSSLKVKKAKKGSFAPKKKSVASKRVEAISRLFSNKEVDF